MPKRPFLKRRPPIQNETKPRMTKFEKVSILLSGAALMMAVALPTVSYFWFDPQFQSFRHRARLQVTPMVKMLAKDEKADIAAILTDKDYSIEIFNLGDLPAKDVSLTLQYGNPVEESFDIAISPPFRVDASNKSNTKFVTLKEPIAPKDKIAIKFVPTPDTIWVTNEFGERTILNTRAPLARIFDDSGSIQIYADNKPLLNLGLDNQRPDRVMTVAESSKRTKVGNIAASPVTAETAARERNSAAARTVFGAAKKERRKNDNSN